MLEKPALLRQFYKLFRDNENKVLTKDEICKKVWGTDYNPILFDNRIYVNISRLKKHLQKNENLKSCSDGYKYSTLSGQKSKLHKFVNEFNKIVRDFGAVTENEEKALDHIIKAINLL